MLRPVLLLCAVLAIGLLVTVGIIFVLNPMTDARGNPLSRLDPLEVEKAASTPWASQRLLASL